MYFPVEHDEGSSSFFVEIGEGEQFREVHVDRIRIAFTKTLILCRECRADILIEALEHYKLKGQNHEMLSL